MTHQFIEIDRSSCSCTGFLEHNLQVAIITDSVYHDYGLMMKMQMKRRRELGVIRYSTANTIWSPNIDLMVGQRRRRWANIKSILGQHISRENSNDQVIQ